MQRRVVITGMGTLNAIGSNTKEFWSALLKGKSGVDLITQFDTTDFTTKIGAEVKNFSAEDFFDKKEIRRLDPYTQYALVCAREAIAQSGLNLEKENRDRIGVIVGSGIGGMLSFETEMTKLITQQNIIRDK